MPFTKQDAENVIALIHRAPMQNLHEAAAVSQLLQRFKTWYEGVVNTPSQTELRLEDDTP